MEPQNTYALQNLESIIKEHWKNQCFDSKELEDVINKIVDLLESGKIRVAKKNKDVWQVNSWVQKAILIYMKIAKNRLIENHHKQGNWFDKIDQKFCNWQDKDFINQQIRAVPGSYVRKSAYIGQNAVLMPCFINVGAFIDSGTMIDT